MNLETLIASSFRTEEIQAAIVAAMPCHPDARIRHMASDLNRVFHEITLAAGPITPDDLMDEQTPAMRCASIVVNVWRMADWDEVARIAETQLTSNIL